MKQLKFLRVLATLVFGASFVIVAFQNCSQTRFSSIAPEVTGQESLQACTDPNCQQIQDNFGTCQFNGATLAHGASITAYQNPSVANGQVCVSQTRSCVNGNLTGTFQYPSCAVDAPANCLFNGQTVLHGESIVAYVNSSGTCDSEKRVCDNGVLSGSYAYAACTPNQPASCLFNGQTVQHGSVVLAFQNSSVPFGQVCQGEFRLCTNGVLSGSFAYGSCEVGQPASCLFNGVTVAHGSTVNAYQNSSVPYGSQCNLESRLCNNGSLSGSYNYSSCEVGQPASCQFNGQTIAHGQSVKAFLTSSVAYGESCKDESRVCSNGVLSGSFVHASCAPDKPASCMFDGKSVAHGESVTAYQNSRVAFGNTCVGQSRTCTNGALSGSYIYGSCVVDQPASCLFNGQTIAHGQSVKAFFSSIVEAGATCKSESRVCTNGVLSGTAPFASCDVKPYASCLFNGRTIPHGDSVVAYLNLSVPYGQTCSSQLRSCINGSLTGSYGHPSCYVENPKSCSLNGTVIPHGSYIYTYQRVNTGQDIYCDTQKRVCNNGSLSGYYTSTSSCWGAGGGGGGGGGGADYGPNGEAVGGGYF